MRPARHGLIESTPTGGRKNVWQLTATGKDLETAIRHETPVPSNPQSFTSPNSETTTESGRHET